MATYLRIVDVKLTTTTEAFDLPEWKSLLASDPNRHIFLTQEYNRVWWEAFGSNKDLYVLTFLDPEPVGLAAIMRDKTNEGLRLRFLGGDDLSDYLGPITAGEEYHPLVADALLSYLTKEMVDWDYFDAKCLPVPMGIADRMVDAADRLGLDFTIEQDEITAVLSLPEDFETYLDKLDRKNRHELKRKMRRLDREAPGSRLVTSQPETMDQDLLAFFGLHLLSEGLKGKFLRPERATFFARLAEVFAPMGMLSLDFLEIDGKKIASTFSFVFEETFYLYNSAYDPSLKRLSPGLILVTKLIQRSIAEGHRLFDFLRGSERYKFDLGAEALPLHSLVISRG